MEIEVDSYSLKEEAYVLTLVHFPLHGLTIA